MSEQAPTPTAETSRHTPGPLSVHNRANVDLVLRRSGCDELNVGPHIEISNNDLRKSLGFTIGPADIALANARLYAAAPDLLAACRAHRAWELAEADSTVTHSARMELCNYAQWLTRKALGETGEYSGVPHIFVDQASMEVVHQRANVETCEQLIAEMFARAALSPARGGKA